MPERRGRRRQRAGKTVRTMTQKKSSKRTQIRLTPNRLGDRIQDVREVIKQQMDAKRMTAYALAKAAKEAGGTLTEQTVRNFLGGANMMSHNLMALMAALDLEVRPKE